MFALTDSLSEFNSSQNYNGVQGRIDWISDTVIHPLVNAAVIEPLNTVSHLLADISGKQNLPEIEALSINRSAETYSPSWFVRSAMSGLGSVVPFVISGKLAGAALRGGLGAISVEARAGALSGAAIYSAMKRPEGGESRLGNAAGTLAAFCVFEAGTTLAETIALKSGVLPNLKSHAIQLATGFTGGALQIQASSLISNQRLASSSQTLESAAAGSFLNLGLGVLHSNKKSFTSESRNSSAADQTQARSSSDVAIDGYLAKSFLDSKIHNETEGISGSAGVPPASKNSYLELAQRYSSALLSSDHTPEPSLIEQSALKSSQISEATLAPEPGRVSASNVAYIVIDSGFNPNSLAPRENILGVWDPTGKGAFSDPLNHGSEVLRRLRMGDPDAKFLLIRAYDGDGNQASTQFQNGKIAQPGWTEAYLEAVALADKLKLPSVANCSFGEFTHAMDGTGWQSFQLSKAIGAGKPGHVVVAASGPGNGAARHASGTVDGAASELVHISQNGEAAFNIWMGKDAPKDWNLSVFRGDELIHSVNGSTVELNLWNNRQQITFRMRSEGQPTRFELSRCSNNDSRPLSFDFWVQEGNAAFLDHLNQTLISEPAVFPDVLAVGLKDGIYAPDQQLAGHKPNVLVPGEGPVSFRTPEVSLAVGKMLKSNPNLDATQIQNLLGKFPLGTQSKIE